MVLPLFLAMNASELTVSPIPDHTAWMACHFSSWNEGITNIPSSLPPNSMLILNDRIPCQGHSANLVADQVQDAVNSLGCESVLLDFQRPDNHETDLIVEAVLSALPCPVCVSECYARNHNCPILLSPPPLHTPLEEYLQNWSNREIWLEAALMQEQITVTKDGINFSRCIPWEGFDGGFPEETLCCRYLTEIEANRIRFTLFDTAESLEKKLQKAYSLGVTRAIGLYQELSP